MSDLGDKIRATELVLKALKAMCSHPTTHPACEDPNSVLVCDDCRLVVTDGILSFTKLGPE